MAVNKLHVNCTKEAFYDTAKGKINRIFYPFNAQSTRTLYNSHQHPPVDRKPLPFASVVIHLIGEKDHVICEMECLSVTIGYIDKERKWYTSGGEIKVYAVELGNIITEEDSKDPHMDWHGLRVVNKKGKAVFDIFKKTFHGRS